MRLVDVHLADVLEIETPRFLDDRGFFQIPYNEEAAAGLGIPTSFVQENHSSSVQRGTVRGLHLQLPPFAQGKLVRVTRGAVMDVVVDVRPGSSTFGEHVMVELSAENARQLWIPAGFAHGFCTLESDSDLVYKVDAPYAPQSERSIRWDDPALGIAWPVAAGEAVLSEKDAAAPLLESVLAEMVDAGRARGSAAGEEDFRG